jgi:hypothetical protein
MHDLFVNFTVGFSRCFCPLNPQTLKGATTPHPSGLAADTVFLQEHTIKPRLKGANYND